MSNFDNAFAIILGQEGGYVNDPNDPGGETNWGITAATLQEAISKGLLPVGTTVTKLTQEQAKTVYKAFYWDAVKGDMLPLPLCIYVFDSAVNQGINPAIKMMQRALGVVQDGVLGAVTLAAAAKANHWVCANYMAYRAMRYQSTKNADKFGVGWLTRTYDVVYRASQLKDAA